MTGKLGSWSLVLLAALALGVAGADGRSLDTTTTVQVQALGLGTVSQSSISCGDGNKICYATYVGSGTITLTAATTEPGWSFSAWSGGSCSGTASTCTLTLDGSPSPHEVIATFTTGANPGTSTLSVSSTGDSTGNGGNVSGGDVDCDTGDSTDCSWDVTTGSTVTMVETPDTGFIFGGWGGGLCSGTARSCTLTMDDDHSVSATFKKPTLTVHVTGNGTVTGGGIVCTSAGGAGCSATETAGSDVTLQATPGAGGSFTDWSGACTGKNATCTITMTGDKSVTATFSGGGPPSTFPLSVSVTGDGTVTGGGLNCGAGGSVCSQNETANSTVTLTATPAAGASFTGWGGACSGTSKTCAVSMSGAKSATATFTGGSSTVVLLSVSVTGRGTVSGGGITCRNGSTRCSAKQKQGSTVGLTASPAAGAVFAGWGGACSGTTPTCTVEMDTAKSVSARFRAVPGRPTTAGAVLRSSGKPIVRRTATGFEVTLRFSTTQRGRAHVRGLRAGRLETALSFTIAPGRATIGPFPLSKPGFYTFGLALGTHTIHWGACLGLCGRAAPGGPFVLTREAASVIHAGAAWSVTVRFRATHAAGAALRIYRGKTLAKNYRFATRAGSVSAGPFLLSPGTYVLRLAAADAYGRSGTLTWYAFLP